MDDGAFDDSDVRWSRDDVRMLLEETPAPIREAEEWRLAGARLRRVAPAVYRQFLELLIASIPDDDENMHKSYFDS